MARTLVGLRRTAQERVGEREQGIADVLGGAPADLIVVLEGGRVSERGSHEQLMRRGGLYAQLFAMQARAYR